MNKLTRSIGVLALIFVSAPSSALADYYQRGGMESTSCFTKVYREEYIPGSGPSNPGRVRKYYERQRVACAPERAPRTHHRPTWIEPRHDNHDTNSCLEGTIIGGIAGGAAGGTLATKDNWIWSIPVGIIGGAMAGCQIDGG